MIIAILGLITSTKPWYQFYFGILDLKTNETFVYCNKGSSTADYKTDYIEKYLLNKKINMILID